MAGLDWNVNSRLFGVLFLPFRMKILNFIGGTLGLFVGVSIMSIVEAIMWIIKYMRKLFCKTKQPKYG